MTNLPLLEQQEDTSIILPVFPWSEPELEQAIGSVAMLRRLVEQGRIVPLIQHPPEYENCQHLDFLFQRNTPSYFVRGQFAYAASLGLDLDIVRNERGAVLLRQSKEYMDYCRDKHATWLHYCKEHPSTWEHRYRQYQIRDQKFESRLESSLCYRYASVALCLGRENADRIVEVFTPQQASDVLLHLHIMFDHVLCHGLASDFLVNKSTPSGQDFVVSKRTGVLRQKEHVLVNNAPLQMPVTPNDSVKAFVRGENILREIDLSIPDPAALPDIQNAIRRRFEEFNRHIERMSRYRKTITWGVDITVYAFSAASAAYGNYAAGAASFIAGLRIPWLTEILDKQLRTMYRKKLSSFLIDQWKR